MNLILRFAKWTIVLIYHLKLNRAQHKCWERKIFLIYSYNNYNNSQKLKIIRLPKWLLELLEISIFKPPNLFKLWTLNKSNQKSHQKWLQKVCSWHIDRYYTGLFLLLLIGLHKFAVAYKMHLIANWKN